MYEKGSPGTDPGEKERGKGGGSLRCPVKEKKNLGLRISGGKSFYELEKRGVGHPWTVLGTRESVDEGGEGKKGT